MEKSKNIIYIIAMLAVLLCVCNVASADDVVRVGMAWQPNEKAYDRVVRSIELAGGEAVILPQMRPVGFEYEDSVLQAKYLDNDGVLLQQYADKVKRDTYHGTAIDSLMHGIDAVVEAVGHSEIFRHVAGGVAVVTSNAVPRLRNAE